MAEVFGSTATSAGTHNGEGMLRKLIKTVRQWKDNGVGGDWPGGGRKALAVHGDRLAIGNILTMLEMSLG